MSVYVTNDTDLTAVADAIRNKANTTDPLTFPNGFVSAIDGISASAPSGAVNCKVYDITLAKSSGWVLLTTLDDEVLEHINESTFLVMLQSVGDYTLESYAITSLVAGNVPLAYQGNYPVYGMGLYQTSATGSGVNRVFYPANNADTGVGLGGIGAFRIADGKCYARSYDAYIHSGAFKLTFAW